MLIENRAAAEALTYRTHRVSRHLQIWLTESRAHRSPNKMPDGPGKSLWGKTQREWLQRILKKSDATWKILIFPTPMVCPDGKHKKDSHANLGGFQHEADEFFVWLKRNEIQGFFTVCGDRHWQFHSIHPSGVWLWSLERRKRHPRSRPRRSSQHRSRRLDQTTLQVQRTNRRVPARSES